EERSSFAELSSDPLVHVVDLAMDKLVDRGVGPYSCEAATARLIGHGLRVGLADRRWKHGTPPPPHVVTGDLEKVRPLAGGGHVRARAAAQGGAEVVGAGQHHEAFWPGVALELDVQVLADGAAPAVTPDEPRCLDDVVLAAGRDGHSHARRRLFG